MLTLKDLQSLARKDVPWEDILSGVNETTGFISPSLFELTNLRQRYIYPPEKFSFHNFSNASRVIDVKTCEQIIVSYDENECCFVTNGQKIHLTRCVAYFECPTCHREVKFEGNPARAHRQTFMCKACQKKVLHKCIDYRVNYENAFEAKYGKGIRRPLQSKAVQEKMTSTMIERYGVPYSMQSNTIVERHKANMVKMYGKENFFSGLNPRIAFPNAIEKCAINGSNFEKEIAEFILTVDPEAYSCLTRYFYITIDDGNTVVPDVYSPTLGLLVEAYGDYWHANPETYNSAKVFHNSLSMQEIHDHDIKRVQSMEAKLGVKCQIVWEKDWKSDPISCKERLLNAIGENK